MKPTAPDSYRPKVALLSLWRAPYRESLVAELLRRGNLDLEVLLMYSKDPAHDYLQHKTVVDGYWVEDRIKKVPLIGEVHASCVQRLTHHSYDVVIVTGHSHPVSFFALAKSMFRGKPFIYSADSVLAGRNPSIKATLRNFMIKSILRRAAAIWIPGAATRRYMESFGVPADRIFYGYYCMDVHSIIQEVEKERENRSRTRKDLDTPEEAFVYLMVANLSPRRHHRRLLEAFQQIDPSLNPYLYLIGSGPELPALQEFCRANGLQNVRFIGNVQFENLAPYYAAADAYVHTGTEPYSTALLYGALAGLPVVTTTHIGGGEDLISGEITPLFVEPDDVPLLYRHLNDLAAHPDSAKRRGSQLQSVAARRDPAWAAEQFEAAVDAALSHSKNN